MDVVFIEGDGIGKEIAQSVRKVNDTLGTDITFHTYCAGCDYYGETGKLTEEGLLEAIGKYGCALKGPTATPIGTGFRSLNVLFRQTFDTYANIRPLKSIGGIDTPFHDIDLIIFRENTEDLYKGLEYMYTPDVAHGIKVISKKASEKIFHSAFRYAETHGRKKVTCVQKANIMKYTDGLFLQVFKEVATQYPQIESDTCLVDAFCMKVVTKPQQFDVVVTENLYGDIISDLCAGLIGGLGFAPSANIGDNVKIYEAVHGSAPDIANQNLANPSAILLSYALLLEDYGYTKEANTLKQALFSTIEEGKTVTKDINGTATTTQFTQAIIERMTK